MFTAHTKFHWNPLDNFRCENRAHTRSLHNGFIYVCMYMCIYILWQIGPFLGDEYVNMFQPTIEGLGVRPVNIYHSKECATIGRPLLGNAWVDTPDNMISFAEQRCVFCGWSVPSLCRKQWRLTGFDRKTSFKVVQQLNWEELKVIERLVTPTRFKRRL
jgi:hypothetical protein